MSDLRVAAQQALEYLERQMSYGTAKDNLIKALEAALAQPATAQAEQSPIGYTTPEELNWLIDDQAEPTEPAQPNKGPLQRLLDYADDSDGCQYGALATSLVRDLVNEALAQHTDAAPPIQPAQEHWQQKTEQHERMFIAACADLGLINEALGLDPDDGGAEPILDAISELKAQVTKPAQQWDSKDAERLFYVIEKFTNGIGGEYWSGVHSDHWTHSIEGAMQYARHVDCYRAKHNNVLFNYDHGLVRIAEHIVLGGMK